jgi:putative glycosyltransferase (TIGR04372 family)
MISLGMTIPAIPIVLFILILRPLFRVRLRRLDFERIGAVYVADWYLAECDRGLHRGCFDIFYYCEEGAEVCNEQWLRMWKKTLRVYGSKHLLRIVDRLGRLFPWWERAHVIARVNHSPQRDAERQRRRDSTMESVYSRSTSNLVFSVEEEEYGRRMLVAMHLEPDASFFCFHCRDSRYLSETQPRNNWSYHDYRDADIVNYIVAAERVAERGHIALRMGAVVEKPIRSKNPSVLDYASNHRCDFMDIYLGAKCRFYLTCDTGISIVPEVFKRPVVYANFVPIARPSIWVRDALIIPKKLFLVNENRPMTFSEIVNAGLGMAGHSSQFNELGVEIRENTPEEIAAVALEMEDRISGVWESNSEDEKLQDQVWNIIGVGNRRSPGFRFGAQFLRDNATLVS